MRINHSLSDNAQLILRIAVEDEEPVKLSEFYKKFHFAKPYEQGFSEAMKIFSGPFKSTTPAEEKKATESTYQPVDFFSQLNLMTPPTDQEKS